MNALDSRPEGPKIIVLIDLENILFSLPVMSSGEKFSLESAFENFIAWLEKIGKVKAVFVLGSEKSIFSRRIGFSKLKWFQILCPKIKQWALKPGYGFKLESEKNQEKDTSDATIIKLWELLNDIGGSWNILCLSSGDIDFTPMSKETLRRGKHIAIAAATEVSLSKELRETASLDPKTREPMVYYFYKP